MMPAVRVSQASARKWMLISAAILLVLGILAVFTASSFQSLMNTDSRSSTMYLLPHVIKILVGVLAGLLAYLAPPVLLKRTAPLLYGASILLLVGLIILRGTHWAPVIKGSARWIALGGFRIMPSEIARISYILLAASLLSDGTLRARSGTGVVWLTLLAVIPAALVCLQPDYAGALYLMLIMIIMLFIAEARFRDILILLLVLFSLASALAMSSEYRRDRLRTWFSPDEADEASLYQPKQACIALGSGGFLGRGLGRGRQQRGFLPEASSDYILAVIGEESGFAGVSIILALLFSMLMSGWLIAERADHLFGYLGAGGLVASIAIGMFVHIGVVTSILPSTGMPLPLVSWGGTNLLVTLASIGFVARVAREGSRS